MRQVVNKTVSQKIKPFAASSLIRKELRQLLKPFWFMLAVLLFFFLWDLKTIFFADLTANINSLEIDSFFTLSPIHFAVNMVLFAGLFGALFFSTELKGNAGSFLFQLPLSRQRLFWTKCAAGLTALMITLTVRILIACAVWRIIRPLNLDLLSSSMQFITSWPVFLAWYLCLLLVAYFGCAAASMSENSAIASLIKGMAIVLLVLIISFMRKAFRFYIELEWFAALGVVGYCWWKFMALKEFEALRMIRPEIVMKRIFNIKLSANSLWLIDLRQKMPLWIMLMAAPLLVAVLSVLVSIFGPDRLNLLPVFVIGLWPYIAAMVSGARLFSYEEMDRDAFFLYQLPMPRGTIIRQRLVAGILFNAALFLEWLLLIALASPFVLPKLGTSLAKEPGGLLNAISIYFLVQIAIFLISALFTHLIHRISAKRNYLPPPQSAAP